jgi:small subunit ribosomal protein S21
MVIVLKKKGETKDSLFRKFTKAFIEENIVDDVRRRQFYKKPSLVRKEREKERRQMRFKSGMRIRSPRGR